MEPPTRRVLRRYTLAFVVGLALPIALSAQPIPLAEFGDRRAEVLKHLNDGILLLHARSAPKEMEQPGWIQDASFLYFTGLVNQPGAILALDGPRREARLFVPPPPLSFGHGAMSVFRKNGHRSMAKAVRLLANDLELSIQYLE